MITHPPLPSLPLPSPHHAATSSRRLVRVTHCGGSRNLVTPPNPDGAGPSGSPSWGAGGRAEGHRAGSHAMPGAFLIIKGARPHAWALRFTYNRSFISRSLHTDALPFLATRSAGLINSLHPRACFTVTLLVLFILICFADTIRCSGHT